MASGTRLREAGQRRPAAVKARPGLLSNSLGVHDSELGEKRLNLNQVYALETMFQSNPAVQAARTVLSGQLLSGGISLKKNGEEVQLTPAFKDHLHEVWVPFAQDVIDSFLKWGICCISYEEHEDDLRRSALLAKRRKLSNPQTSAKSGRSSKAKQAVEQAQSEPPQIIPIVPALGSYEVAFFMGGRAGYKREYLLYSNAPGQGTREDEEARVIVRQHPDQVGNVNSPLASVFELGSFVAALTELAVIAEASRARPRIVTQVRKKDANALDPTTLFFDSESRAVQQGADTEENGAQVRALQLQQQLCAVINKMQTTNPKDEHDLQSFSGAGNPKASKQAYAPPEVQPSLFNLPKDQECAPNTSTPESRGDLESLTRLSIEQFSAAFGVPSDLIFSGRFAGKSTSQLSLLNITVSQLAKSVNSVMTIAYRDIYASGPDEDVGQLQLLTSPLAATDEVLNLYAGGLVPVEIAMPAVLHAIGTTKEDIDNALENAKSLQKEKEECERCEQQFAKADHDMNIEERKVGLKKVEAEANKIEHDAKAPYSSSGGGSSGGGGSSSGGSH